MGEQQVPFSSYRTQVREDWLDYNGHMHDASYAIVLSDANEELFVALGLGAEYRVSNNASFYTVETHIRYLAECSLGQVLSAATLLVAADAKKVRLYTEVRHDDGRLAATGDCLYLHVDTTIGATVAMPPDRHGRVLSLLAAHAGLPRPSHLGLGVGAAHARAVQG